MQQRVLLIEDSRTQALRIQLELLRHGLEVEIAGSGDRGIESGARKSASRDHP